MAHPLKLVGGPASPYSCKMRAVLRYRRIPFEWTPQHSDAARALPSPKVPIIPVLGFVDDAGVCVEVMTDSSPQITRLEQLYPERRVVPVDPVVAFLDFLLEDFADEWLTKIMYHYRWAHPRAVDKAGRLLPLQADTKLDDAPWHSMRDWITNRQVDRRSLVGSTEENRPVLEDSYVRVLRLLEQHLTGHDFLFGDRPGRADFGLYGQLSQLTWWEPESAAIAVQEASRVVIWTDRVADLSWWPTEGDAGWVDRAALPPTTLALLHEAGRTYAPFMLANHAAFPDSADGGEGGDGTVHCTIDGRPYSQPRFPYQKKCLDWIRSEYGGLAAPDRAAVDDLLADTGCEPLLA